MHATCEKMCKNFEKSIGGLLEHWKDKRVADKEEATMGELESATLASNARKAVSPSVHWAHLACRVMWTCVQLSIDGT